MTSLLCCFYWQGTCSLFWVCVFWLFQCSSINKISSNSWCRKCYASRSLWKVQEPVYHDQLELNCPMLNAAIISCGDDVGPQSDITMLNRFAYMMTDHVWCCQLADRCEAEERRWGLVLPALVNWDSSQIYSSPESWRCFLAKYFHCNKSCVTFQTTIPQCTEYFAPRNWV